MRFELLDRPPKRKPKPKPSFLEDCEEFRKLKAVILNGNLAPATEAGLYFDQKDVDVLQVKFPWRMAVDRLRKLVKSMGLESQYQVRKYETDIPGQWFVGVKRK